jgi:hypothetical protein
MKKILTTFLFISVYIFCMPGERLSIDFTYPNLSGDFYVNGRVSFPPDKILSEDNIIVSDLFTNQEIPTKITIIERWIDGSVLEAEILFPANTSKQKKYVLIYGKDIKRKKKFAQTSVLPIINASIGKLPLSTESINIDVGEMLIKVDKSPEIRYYWYILPISLLLFLTIYRSIKNSKQYEK